MCSFNPGRLTWGLLFCVAIFLGCDQTPAEQNRDGANAEKVVQETDAESNEPAGYLEQANQLFQKAKDAGQTTATSASEWVSDQVSGAMDASGSAVQETGDWVNETFESLKDQGLTTAGDATEWVQEDLRNMNSFEYMVIAKNLTTAEEELNRLGNQRWECFAVDDQALYLKRKSKSYLRHVPVKDLFKFLPVGGDGE